MQSGATNRQDALRLLQGLEDGRLPVSTARALATNLDPVLFHVVVRYLREVYPASNPAAHAVLSRVVALTANSPGLVAKSKQGERDPVSVWFATTHSFGDFRGRGSALVELIADKLES